MIRVLLIDDEEDALDLLEILLEQVGDVTVVGRYMNPLEAMASFDPSAVDAVFLDHQMPGLNGMEVARQIRRRVAQMPIVFTTAYAEYAVEAFEVHTMDYLLKPFTLERLHNAVERIRYSLSNVPYQVESHGIRLPVVQCLGGFYILKEGSRSNVLSWKTKKEKELCAYLLHYAGKPSSTAAILEAIWPEYDLKKAKSYLYTCLSYLRRSLEEHRVPLRIIKADSGFMVDFGAALVDVIELEGLLSRWLESADSAGEWNTEEYNKMNKAYSGDYMEACDFRWAEARQMQIRATYARALRKWYVHFRRQLMESLAVDSLQRIVNLIPDSEQDGRELIALYLEIGNRKEAYRACIQLEETVRLQLGVELEEETLLLIEQTKSKVLSPNI